MLRFSTFYEQIRSRPSRSSSSSIYNHSSSSITNSSSSSRGSALRGVLTGGSLLRRYLPAAGSSLGGASLLGGSLRRGSLLGTPLNGGPPPIPVGRPPTETPRRTRPSTLRKLIAERVTQLRVRFWMRVSKKTRASRVSLVCLCSQRSATASLRDRCVDDKLIHIVS